MGTHLYSLKSNLQKLKTSSQNSTFKMADDKPKADGATGHVNLKVCGQDGSVVQFKIKKNTQLKKLMNAYCDRQVSTSTRSDSDSMVLPSMKPTPHQASTWKTMTLSTFSHNRLVAFKTS